MRYKPKYIDGQEITLTTRITSKSSQNLLLFLSSRFTYHSPDEWAERIAAGKVLVNGGKASDNQPLRPGDEIAYTTRAWEEPPVKTDYRVVYEDETLLALSKPAPLPVHAIGAYFQNTLMHLLRRDRPEAADYHPVHRIDSETSGLLLLAKDRKYINGLANQWKTGMVQKTYLAIVFGKFPHALYRMDGPIGPLVGGKVRMRLCVDPENGKPASTEFELVETKGNFSLLKAKPLTGRTHQIRVHLEHMGFPIVGDKLYAGNEETFLHFYEHGWDEWLKERVLLKRLALHANRLEFDHPVTGQRMELESPFPEDLNEFWMACQE